MNALYLMGISLTALLSENFVLVNCLGIGSRTQALKDPNDARKTGLSLTAVMVLTAVVGWVLHQFLHHYALDYYQTLVFALLGPCMVGCLRWFLKSCVPELSHRLDENLSSITFNCAAMGVALLIAGRGYTLSASFLYALFGGLGATGALISFAGLKQEVSLTSCPKSVQGLPIELITAGLMALALVGFYGLHLE